MPESISLSEEDVAWLLDVRRKRSHELNSRQRRLIFKLLVNSGQYDDDPVPQSFLLNPRKISEYRNFIFNYGVEELVFPPELPEFRRKFKTGFKYRPFDELTFERDVSMIKSGAVWFAGANTLNDPSEGTISFYNNALSQDDFHSSLRLMQLDIESCREKSLVFCALALREHGMGFFPSAGITLSEEFLPKITQLSRLSISELKRREAKCHKEIVENFLKEQLGIYSICESPSDAAMWSLYANGHQGALVEYDLEVVQSNLPAETHIFPMAYQRSPLEISSSDIFRLTRAIISETDQFDLFLPHLFSALPIREVRKVFGVKSPDYSLEKELRLISRKIGLHKVSREAIRSIIVGANMSFASQSKLREELTGTGISLRRAILRDRQVLIEDRGSLL